MKLPLLLPPELGERLHHEAEKQGISDDALAAKLLDERLPKSAYDQETIAILQSWNDEEVEEADKDYDLFQVLDAASMSGRKLFPEEKKGITW